MMEFYLQADEIYTKEKDSDGNYKKRLAIREYYKFTGGGAILRGGRAVPAQVSHGMVDDAIISQHEKEHAKFKAHVDANFDTLAAEAKKQPGKPLMIDLRKKVEIEE